MVYGIDKVYGWGDTNIDSIYVYGLGQIQIQKYNNIKCNTLRALPTHAHTDTHQRDKEWKILWNVIILNEIMWNNNENKRRILQ